MSSSKYDNKLFYNAAYNNHDVKGSRKSFQSDKEKGNRNLTPEGQKKVHEDRLPEVNILYTCSIVGSQITNAKVLHLPQIQNIIPEKL